MARPRSFDKEVVLDQIMIYFWRHGYQQTGFRQLAGKLGIQAQSLYNAYGNKQKLYFLALEHYVSVAGDLAQQIVATSQTGWQKLQQVLILDWGDLPYPPGCMVISSLSEFDEIDPQLNLVANELFNHLTTIFQTILRDLAPELRSNGNTAETAAMLLTVHNGIQVAVRDRQYPTDINKIVASTLAGLKREELS